MWESPTVELLAAGIVLALLLGAVLISRFRAKKQQTQQRRMRNEAELSRGEREESLKDTVTELRRNVHQLTRALDEKTALFERWGHVLQEFQDRMASRPSVQDMAELTVQAAAGLFPASHSAFYLLKENLLIPMAQHGFARTLPKQRMGEGKPGWIAKHQVPLHRGDPYFATIRSAHGEPEVQVGIPIVGMGHLLGVLVVGGPTPQPPESKKHLLMLAQCCSPNLLHALGGVQKQVSATPIQQPGFRLFSLDEFTQRTQEECEKGTRFQRAVSLALFRLDRLPELLRNNGRQQAQQVVKAFCTVLQSQLRSYDIAAQRTADEFLILCPEADKKATRLVAERIRQRYSASVQEIMQQTMGIHCGVVTFPEDGDTAKGLIDAARHAVSQGAEEGDNRIT